MNIRIISPDWRTPSRVAPGVPSLAELPDTTGVQPLETWVQSVAAGAAAIELPGFGIAFDAPASTVDFVFVSFVSASGPWVMLTAALPAVHGTPFRRLWIRGPKTGMAVLTRIVAPDAALRPGGARALPARTYSVATLAPVAPYDTLLSALGAFTGRFALRLWCHAQGAPVPDVVLWSVYRTAMDPSPIQFAQALGSAAPLELPPLELDDGGVVCECGATGTPLTVVTGYLAQPV